MDGFVIQKKKEFCTKSYAIKTCLTLAYEGYSEYRTFFVKGNKSKGNRIYFHKIDYNSKLHFHAVLLYISHNSVWSYYGIHFCVTHQRTVPWLLRQFLTSFIMVAL